MTTVAPSEANRVAVAAPIPDDEPVTSTTWPPEGGVVGWGGRGRGLGHGPSVRPGWPTVPGVRPPVSPSDQSTVVDGP